MHFTTRNHNVITGEKTLEPLRVFPNFPIYIACTDQPEKDDIRADLSLAICAKTGIIQVDKLLPLDVVYAEYHSEALGGVWNEHHLSFVDFVHKYQPQYVLEIGGSNGFIAKECLKKGGIKKWLLVEPTPACENDGPLEVVTKNFDENFVYDGKVDTIIHSHTFEHIYEPAAFMKQIAGFLKEGSLHLFSIPNLYRYLAKKYANWINFEHTVFLTEHYIDYLLAINGFKILEKKYFYDHSIFYATKKVSSHPDNNVILANKYAENKALFADFMKYYKDLIQEFNGKIQGFEGEVYLFGAHIFSHFLLHMGLSNKIVKILDNSKIKTNKRLYGTGLFVDRPEIIAGKDKVAVILKAGSYQEEIRKQLLEINQKTVIWE